MDIKVIAVNENLQQLKMKDVERGFAILSVYQEGGYTDRQAIQGTKFLDNHLAKAKDLDPRN